jgi:hypothetical protein
MMFNCLLISTESRSGTYGVIVKKHLTFCYAGVQNEWHDMYTQVPLLTPLECVHRQGFKLVTAAAKQFDSLDQTNVEGNV